MFVYRAAHSEKFGILFFKYVDYLRFAFDNEIFCSEDRDIFDIFL